MHYNQIKTGLLFLIFVISCNPQKEEMIWPDVDAKSKVWTRWWWMGSAVDKQNIKSTLVSFKEVGIGGVEITPLYGVKGEEDNFIDYLSPNWIEMLDYTIKISDSLDMEVDMVQGTGWPFGGKKITREDAATKLVYRKYKLKKGESLTKKNSIIQPKNEKDKESSKLQYVIAYFKEGSYRDLSTFVHEDKLDWKAPENCTVYAIFEGKTGQQVKRAAPGGEGFTMDHYSNEALNKYNGKFKEAFSKLKYKLNGVFNDSYEVYDTDYTSNFFQEFESRRGYDLKTQLPVLFDSTHINNNRILSDYRETISDLLLNNFHIPWTKWANEQGIDTRLQAHGSPGNLIDMYATATIPECETFGAMYYDVDGLRREEQNVRNGDADPVMLKFSSSAAHLSGKKYISSESFTWLREHFKTALSQCKPELEDLFLNGVNHVFLHGSTYSPKRAKWPGWKFYASVNFNENNSIWEDAPELFSYISRSQSLLQKGSSDNELLVYWPVYDLWAKDFNNKLLVQISIHNKDEWLTNTDFYNQTLKLINSGYGVDIVSDAFINSAFVKEGEIVLPGKSYKTIVIPDVSYMPLATLKKLIELKKSGANIIFHSYPKSVPGFNNLLERSKELKGLLLENKKEIILYSNVVEQLKSTNIYPESITRSGLKFIRRDLNGDKLYYIVNHTANSIDKTIELAIGNKEVLILDALTGNSGKSQSNTNSELTKVRVQIPSGGSLFLETRNSVNAKDWNYYENKSKAEFITGKWNLSFLKGGPKLPNSMELDTLKSWTDLGDEAEAFSGTGVYTIDFNSPSIKADNWLLNLGDLRESAKIWLNDKYIGAIWSLPNQINLGQLQKGKNQLKIQVTNLSANRIRDLEIKGEEWKIFHEINMVNKDYQKFDATKWEPVLSGLLGPVTITPQIKSN